MPRPPLQTPLPGAIHRAKHMYLAIRHTYHYPRFVKAQGGDDRVVGGEVFGEEDAGGEPVCFGEVGEFDAGFVRVQRGRAWGGGGGGGGVGMGLRRETGETAGEVENSFFKTERCDALDTACLVARCNSQRVFATSQCSPLGVGVVGSVGISRWS